MPTHKPITQPVSSGRVSTVHWPLVWVTPGPQAGAVETKEILKELSNLLHRTGLRVMLFDLSDMAMPSAETRKALADHMLRNKELIAQRVAGITIVATNPLIRGVVTALFWLAPPVVPHRVFATTAEAEAWARQTLAAHGGG